MTCNNYGCKVVVQSPYVKICKITDSLISIAIIVMVPVSVCPLENLLPNKPKKE